MIPPTAVVALKKNKKTGHFLLIHYALQKKVGWSVGWGQPDTFTQEEFREHGLDAVIKSLNEYDLRDGCNKAKIPTLTKEEQRRVTRENLEVSIGINGEGQLLLRPSHREKGGYVGQETITLNRDCSAANFYDQVQAAFAVSS